MNNTIEKTVGELVAEDYRTSQVFKNHKIDFCCKGNRKLSEVVTKQGITLENLLEELQTVQNSEKTAQPDFKTWPLDLLIDYIEKKHHRYVEQQIPVLKQYLTKLCLVHGTQHPELHQISEHFHASAGELAMHIKKEELILFPWIRKMLLGPSYLRSEGKALSESVQTPIKVMMQEHDNEGERFRKIAELSQEYTPPSDACNTYRVTFSLLKEFEDDLHRHIHLENNILFPKAEILETQLT